jgi:hypothetical protein
MWSLLWSSWWHALTVQQLSLLGGVASALAALKTEPSGQAQLSFLLVVTLVSKQVACIACMQQVRCITRQLGNSLTHATHSALQCRSVMIADCCCQPKAEGMLESCRLLQATRHLQDRQQLIWKLTRQQSSSLGGPFTAAAVFSKVPALQRQACMPARSTLRSEHVGCSRKE